MRRTRLLVVGGLILITLIFAYSQSRLPSAQTRQAVTPTAESQPVKAQKVLVRDSDV